MERYVFSGSLTRRMVDELLSKEDFTPIDVLVSQLDRSAIKTMLEFIKMGAVKSLFIDSGAFSQYTEKCGKIDIEEYAEYVNGLDEHIYAIAQVDTLPGKFGKPKEPQDYIESSEKSWENYLYMRTLLKSPEKLIYVYHYGEPISALKRACDWRDESKKDVQPFESEVLGKVYPDRLNILGLSPANDTHQAVKDDYLGRCYDIISRSTYPDIKTHLFGMTCLPSLAKFPCYSADSVSHRLRTGYGKVFLRKYGVINLSAKAKAGKSSNDKNFYDWADESTKKDLDEIFASYGYTIDDIKNDNVARVVVDVLETDKAWKQDFVYKPTNRLTRYSLFEK